ncbi:Crp/Fnr family transcriptional regulator [Taibaiella koreensis]|uniref:Crp/Fnr family transcriptional regulator n=1 Tax=Taibaiella koreensis TaxID=1268548 RepID=UPI000E59E441|nr:Crp/Fnr family transcriptional regulator [Taibaiella koreensis]
MVYENPTPEGIKKVFDNFFVADIEVWSEFAKYINVRTFAKHEVIKDYHATEKYINILIKGSAAHFVWNGDRDICISLYYENNIFSDYLSFLSQKPTVLKSEALEDTITWSVNHRDLNLLFSKSVRGIMIGKAISDALFIKKQMEQTDLLTLTPTERYLKMIKERPEIVQRTPLKVIASYLGLTAESLSRIRKRIV